MSYTDPLYGQGPGRGVTRDQLKHNWGWIVAMGLIFLISGVVALYHVTTATLVTVIWIGAAMLVAGGMQLVTAFRIRDWSRAVFVGLMGALSIIAGVITFQHPMLAAVTITMLIAISLILSGVLKLIVAWHIRDLGPWAVVALSGVLSVALGLMLLAQWPFSGVYALGLFLALGLIMEGVAWLVMGFAVKADYPSP